MVKHQPEPPKGNALRRLTVLSSLISALIRGGRASLQSIGSQMESPTDLESRIKQAKRWLNSKWTDVDAHFIPYILPILLSLSKTGRLLLAIDGSGVGKDCTALMLSAIWKGRAIPLCWIVRKVPKGNFPKAMHIDLVNELSILLDSILEEECQIVLLGDGEFDSWELQQACLDQGWDYVLKTAKDTLIADNPQMENASQMRHLASEQTSNHLMLKDMYFTKEGKGALNVVWWHDPKYKHPLFLLTNLDYAPQVEFFYRKRYRIETFFGDIKSRGFNIHRTKIDKPQTLFNLLIVAALCFILAILFEPVARTSTFLSKFCRKDQVNHLSIFQLGLRGLQYYIKHLLNIYFQFSKNFP